MDNSALLFLYFFIFQCEFLIFSFSAPSRNLPRFSLASSLMMNSSFFSLPQQKTFSLFSAAAFNFFSVYFFKFSFISRLQLSFFYIGKYERLFYNEIQGAKLLHAMLTNDFEPSLMEMCTPSASCNPSIASHLISLAHVYIN